VGVAFPRGARPDEGGERPACSEAEDSLSLAVDAAQDCLARSQHTAGDIGLLVSASVAHRPTRGRAYQVEPSMSFAVKESVGARGAVHLDLSHADAGMLTGVLLVDDFIARGVIRCGMVVSGECLSRLGPGDRRRLREPHGHEHPPPTDAGAAVLLERSSDGRPGVALATFGPPPALDDALILSGPSPYGDSASATPLLALARGLREGAIRRGDRVAMIAGAPDQVGVVLLVIDALAEAHGRTH
jgi:3-oxoacyl-[acyl-carrier-protein] synthase III